MKHVASLFPTLPKPTKSKGSERGDLIKYFRDNIKDGYKLTTGRELTYPYLAMRLAHLDKSDLYYLKGACNNTNKDFPFSKIFWSKISIKKTL